MVQVFWAAKGGSGASTIAVAVARGHSDAGRSTLLVDGLGPSGDITTILGVEPGGPTSAHMQARRVAPNLDLWIGELGVERLSLQVTSCYDEIVVDGGSGTVAPEAVTPWVPTATSVVAVVRCGVVDVRRLAESEVARTGHIVVAEPGRGLRPSDVAAFAGCEQVAMVVAEPRIQRWLDAGALSAPPPRRLARSLAGLR